MSATNNGRQPRIHFPEFPVEWWMITGEWYEQVQEASIATAENPNASGRVFMKRRCATTVFNQHPILFSIVNLMAGRGEYAVLEALPITKKMYDFVMSGQNPPEESAAAQASEIAQRIDAEKNNTPEPDDTSKGN